MGLRKWNDNKGWSRGAKGIDEEKGVDFVWKYVDAKAQRAQFGRCYTPDGDISAADASELSGGKDTKAWSESPDYDTK